MPSTTLDDLRFLQTHRECAMSGASVQEQVEHLLTLIKKIYQQDKWLDCEAKNRHIILQKEVADLLTPEVIYYLFLDPTGRIEAIEPLNEPPIFLHQLFIHAFEQEPLLPQLGNLLSDYGKRRGILTIQKQYEEHTSRIKKAAKAARERLENQSSASQLYTPVDTRTPQSSGAAAVPPDDAIESEPTRNSDPSKPPPITFRSMEEDDFDDIQALPINPPISKDLIKQAHDRRFSFIAIQKTKNTEKMVGYILAKLDDLNKRLHITSITTTSVAHITDALIVQLLHTIRLHLLSNSQKIETIRLFIPAKNSPVVIAYYKQRFNLDLKPQLNDEQRKYLLEPLALLSPEQLRQLEQLKQDSEQLEELRQTAQSEKTYAAMMMVAEIALKTLQSSFRAPVSFFKSEKTLAPWLIYVRMKKEHLGAVQSLCNQSISIEAISKAYDPRVSLAAIAESKMYGYLLARLDDSTKTLCITSIESTSTSGCHIRDIKESLMGQLLCIVLDCIQSHPGKIAWITMTNINAKQSMLMNACFKNWVKQVGTDTDDTEMMKTPLDLKTLSNFLKLYLQKHPLKNGQKFVDNSPVSGPQPSSTM